MSVHEELSWLLAGELPPDRAEALRHRIATDPQVRAVWESLVDMQALLEEMPLEITPPAALDRRVLGEPGLVRRKPFRAALPMVAGITAALAAAFLGWVLVTGEPQPDFVLVDGAQWVSGAALVHAGDARIEVDGIARITVEPPAGSARVNAPRNREDSMRREAVVAGLVGSIVTVTVYEGQARVHPSEGPATIVNAGETHAIGKPPEQSRASEADEPVGDNAAETIARLQRSLEETRTKLAEAEFVAALTRGQLVAHQGEVSTWPEVVPASVSAAHFETELKRRLGERPLVVEHVDCSEYPCLAAIRYGSEGDEEDWFQGVEADLRAIGDEAYGDAVSLALSRFKFKDDEAGEAEYILFGTWDGEGAANEPIRQRTTYRLDQLVTEIDGQLRDEAPR